MKTTNTHKQIKAWSTLLFPNYPSIVMNSIYIFQSEIIFRVTSILFIYKSKKAMYYFTQFFRNIFWSTLCIYSTVLLKGSKVKVVFILSYNALLSIYASIFMASALLFLCSDSNHASYSFLESTKEATRIPDSYFVPVVFF